jgi:hypothetical protein
MRLIKLTVILSLVLIGTQAVADVVLVKAGSASSTGRDSTIDSYDRNIEKLNHMSAEISAQIFSRKQGLKMKQDRANDGMQITLVKVSR